jgi:hypothetical protein
MVGEAQAHVQGESLKVCAAFRLRLLNSPIARTGSGAVDDDTEQAGLPAGTSPPKSQVQPASESVAGVSGAQLKAAWVKGQTLAALSLAQQAGAEESPERTIPQNPVDRKSALERIAQAKEALQDPTLREVRRQRYIRAIARAESELGLDVHPSVGSNPNLPSRAAEATTNQARLRPETQPEKSSAILDGKLKANGVQANLLEVQSPPQMESAGKRLSENQFEGVMAWLVPIGQELGKIGLVLAKFWLVLAGLAVLFGFPLSGICASFLVGWCVMKWAGGGAIVLFPVAFLFGLFLSVYVWEPHVKPVVMEAVEALHAKLDRM